MNEKFVLGMAGNVFPVAYEIIKNKGYQILKEGENYIAESNGQKFIAKDDIVQLLGLITIYETKGENWATTDQVIDEFLKNLD
ncbi:MAG: hypothetical protein WC120_01930 [Parcubacteria group bacterium]